MSDLSMSQQEFLAKEKLYKRQVRICRAMVLVLLLALWELCTQLGLIDSFIFSSPVRIWKCFLVMAGDGSIFHHIGVTLFETLVSFFWWWLWGWPRLWPCGGAGVFRRFWSRIW